MYLLAEWTLDAWEMAVFSHEDGTHGTDGEGPRLSYARSAIRARRIDGLVKYCLTLKIINGIYFYI